VTTLLVDSSAEVDTVNVMGASALVCAARGGHTSVVYRLLEAGASVNNDAGKAPSQVNPLMSAAIAGHESVCRVLLDKNADVNISMADTGWTPLMFAAHNGYLQVVQLLLDKGADSNAQNVLGDMALDVAHIAGHLQVKAHLYKISDTTLSATMKRRMFADIFDATKEGDYDRVKVRTPGVRTDYLFEVSPLLASSQFKPANA
jgi:ankyrin repeat protein